MKFTHIQANKKLLQIKEILLLAVIFAVQACATDRAEAEAATRERKPEIHVCVWDESFPSTVCHYFTHKSLNLLCRSSFSSFSLSSEILRHNSYNFSNKGVY